MESNENVLENQNKLYSDKKETNNKTDAEDDKACTKDNEAHGVDDVQDDKACTKDNEAHGVDDIKCKKCFAEIGKACNEGNKSEAEHNDTLVIQAHIENDKVHVDNDKDQINNIKIKLEIDKAYVEYDNISSIDDIKTPTEDDRAHVEGIKDDKAHMEDMEAHSEDDNAHVEDIKTPIEDNNGYIEDIKASIKDDKAHMEDMKAHSEDNAHVEDIKAPIEDDKVHVDNIKAPIEDNNEYIEDIKTPIEDDKGHMEDIEIPTEGNKAPIEDDNDHVEDIKAPIEDDKGHIEDIKVPTEGNKAPIADDNDHVEDIKAPIEDDKAQIEDIKVPTEGNKAPIEDDNDHVEDIKAPIEDDKVHVEDINKANVENDNPVVGDKVRVEDNSDEDRHSEHFEEYIDDESSDDDYHDDDDEEEQTIDPQTFDNLDPEYIVDHKEEDGVRYYLIKWANVGERFNSWLPVFKMNDCDPLFYDYQSRKPDVIISPLEPVPEIIHLYHVLKWCTEVELRDLVTEHVTPNGLQFPFVTKNNIMERLAEYLKRRRIAVPERKPELTDIRREILLLEILKRREKQLAELEIIQTEINSVGDHAEDILVVNEVNLEVPTRFNYINEYINDFLVPISDKVGDDGGCKCAEGCYGAGCCITKATHGRNPSYDRNGRVIQSNLFPIYECNSACKCDDICVNRVTQRGCQVKLCIFRTANGCGWGVRTLQYLQSGTFIARYVGRVMKREQASWRGSRKPRVRHYLLDMDFNNKLSGGGGGGGSEFCTYTVDASDYGNVARFINHSCDPNLLVYSVWLNPADQDFHHISLFTNRDVAAGEELTFNYLRNMADCRCMSGRCRRFYR